MKKHIKCRIVHTLLMLLVFAPAASVEALNRPLWDEFWAYDIRQLVLTHGPGMFSPWRENLTSFATRAGDPPASDAPVVRTGYAEGTVRALFILRYRDTRHPLELASRFDMLEYDVLPSSLFSVSARAGDGFQKDRSFDAAEFESRLLSAIEGGEFDVIVTHMFDGGVLSAEGQQRMRDWVSRGMGWVDMGTAGNSNAVQSLFPVERKGESWGTPEQPGSGHFIRSGMPEGLYIRAATTLRPAGSAVMSFSEGIDRRGSPVKDKGVVVAAHEVGDGRVVSYCAGWPGYYVGYLYPAGTPAGQWVWYRSGGLWDEAKYSLLMRSILWAAGKHTDVFAGVVPGGNRLHADSGEGIPLRISASDGSLKLPTALKVNWQLRDETGVVYQRGSADIASAGRDAVDAFLRPSSRLLAGTSELFYEVRDGAGGLVGWGEDIIEIEGDLRFSDIILPDYYERSAREFTAMVMVENAGQTESEVSLSVQLLDSHNRRLPFLAIRQLSLGPESTAKAEISLPVDFEYLFGPMGFAHIELSKGRDSEALARRKVPFFAPAPPADTLNDWQVGVQTCGQDSFWPAYARVLRAYGFDAIFRGIWRYPCDLLYLSTHGFNLYTEYIYTALGHWGRKYGENIWFWDPATRQGHRSHLPHWKEEGREQMKRLVGRAASLRKLGVVGYAASEEIGLGPQEVCFSEPAQAYFRRWAFEKYGSLEALNAAWGSDYRTQDDVVGILLEDALARDSGNPAQWMAFRMFMEEAFNSRLEKYTRIGKTVAPEGFWGYVAGPHAEVPLQGHNRSRLGKTITQCVEYIGPWNHMGSITSYFDVLRSRNVPALLSVIGYPNPYFSDLAVQFRDNIWYTALYGGRGAIYYAAIHPPRYAKLDGTGAPLRVTELIREINAELAGGLGRLIIHSERSSTGIGLYYSRSSEYALTWHHRALLSAEERSKQLEEERKAAETLQEDPGGGGEVSPDMPAVKANMFRHFRAHSFAAMRELALSSGYNYDMVFEDQLVSGQLHGKYRVLLIPGLVSLCDAELDALKSFVAEGGLLVADMGTGIYDELGRPWSRLSEVEVLFGIDRNSSDFALEQVSGTLAEHGPVEGYGTDDARAGKGRALGSVDGRDVAIINKNGKGTTLYLNMVPKRHGNWGNVARDPLFVSESFRKLFIRLAEAVGAPRPIVLAGTSGQKKIAGMDNVDIVRFDRGGNYSVFFYSKPNASADPAPVLARLDTPLHVYDMLRRAYLGHTDRPYLEMPEPSHAAAYAFLPYQVMDLEVSVPARVKAGEEMAVRVHLLTEGGSPEEHVVRIELYEPDGILNWRFSRNIDVSGGRSEVVLPLTFDEQPGQWRLKARDVQSGISTEKTFSIEP